MTYRIKHALVLVCLAFLTFSLSVYADDKRGPDRVFATLTLDGNRLWRTCSGVAGTNNYLVKRVEVTPGGVFTSRVNNLPARFSYSDFFLRPWPHSEYVLRCFLFDKYGGLVDSDYAILVTP